MKRAPINTRRGKRVFIRGLCRSVARSVTAAVPQMPSAWDGHELRELLAEIFGYERTNIMRTDRRRRKAFRSARYNIGRI